MKLKHDQAAIQCCKKHWGMMEQALTDRGMDHLFSSNSDEAEKQFKEAEGVPWVMTDPLLEAFTMMGAQLICSGIPPDQIKEFGGKEICPVCTAMSLTESATPENTETHWTGGLADFLLSEYRERGTLDELGCDYTTISQLVDFYGLDIRHLGHRKWCLVGEWFGKTYIDYLAEKVKPAKVRK